MIQTWTYCHGGLLWRRSHFYFSADVTFLPYLASPVCMKSIAYVRMFRDADGGIRPHVRRAQQLPVGRRACSGSNMGMKSKAWQPCSTQISSLPDMQILFHATHALAHVLRQSQSRHMRAPAT
eukprot:3484719-Pleurochrysis_carterae.AAC.2